MKTIIEHRRDSTLTRTFLEEAMRNYAILERDIGPLSKIQQGQTVSPNVGWELCQGTVPLTYCFKILAQQNSHNTINSWSL